VELLIHEITILFISGDTVEELKRNMQEAIGLHLEGLR
jgi:predicted RNase H-like HicB family nuclease